MAGIAIGGYAEGPRSLRKGREFMFRAVCVALVVGIAGIGWAGPTENAKKALEATGFKNIKQLLEVPDAIQGPLVSLAMLQENEEPIINSRGERIGNVSKDTVEWIQETFPVNSVWYAEREEANVVLFIPGYVLFFRDSPPNRPGRLVLEVLFLKVGKSVVFLLK
jgi:hypothetical protein